MLLLLLMVKVSETPSSAAAKRTMNYKKASSIQSQNMTNSRMIQSANESQSAKSCCFASRA